MSNVPPTDNPYASPLFSSRAAVDLSSPDAVRNKYLKHEASVKSVGLLYLLGGTVSLILSLVYIGMGAGVVTLSGAELSRRMLIVVGIVFFAMSIVQLYSGISIRKLGSAGRIIITVFSVIGLLGVPVGTLISGFILYLLWSQKGNFVFTSEYQEVIKATPHIKYKTSIVVWILLGLLLLFLGVGLFATLADSNY